MAKIDDRCAHFLFFSLYVSIFAEFLFSIFFSFSQKSFQIVKGLLENLYIAQNESTSIKVALILMMANMLME